jgi:dTDP-4-amino-4,6-dideoxygalactose transaminase
MFILNKHKIQAVFHYQSLHSSLYYSKKHDKRKLVESDKFTHCLLRLPLWVGLRVEDIIFKIKE